MGNAMTQLPKKPLTIHDLSVKVGEYRTINEGDPEMVEDPEFPVRMMHEALDRNNTIEGNVVRGTYVYYPNKKKPKMWIGNYKILNPEDILCEDIAAKIGMSEMQWRKYIEHRTSSMNEDGKKDYYTDFDYMSSEQKKKLTQLMKESSVEYPFETNYNINELDEAEFDQEAFDQYGYKSPQDYINYDQNDGDYSMNYIYEQDEEQIKKDFIEYNQNIYNCSNTNISGNENGEETYDPNAYIEQLNEQARRIRRKQEHEIYQRQRQLMRYGNTNVVSHLTGRPTNHSTDHPEIRNRRNIAMMKTKPKYVQYVEERKMAARATIEGAEEGLEDELEEKAEDRAEERVEKREEEEEEEKEKEEEEKEEEKEEEEKEEEEKEESDAEAEFEATEQFAIKAGIVKDVTFSKDLPRKAYKSLTTMSTKASLDFSDRMKNNVKDNTTKIKKARLTRVMT